MYLYYAMAAAVFFATLAMMVREGLWSNTITLVSIVFSGLVAFGFYQPLTVWVDEQLDGSYTYWLDIVCLWGLYSAAMIVLSGLAGLLSRTRLRFKNPIDPIGGPVVAVIAAWVMMTMVLASLHTAPLSKDAMGGALVHSERDVKEKSVLSAPDLWWLRFVESVSSNDEQGEPRLIGTGNPFSAWAYILINADHREKFEQTESYLVRRG